MSFKKIKINGLNFYNSTVGFNSFEPIHGKNS